MGLKSGARHQEELADWPSVAKSSSNFEHRKHEAVIGRAPDTTDLGKRRQFQKMGGAL
jgi:hypothetical protein